MNSKGFIFDLDGVIVDTAQYHFLAWQKLASEIGINFSESDNEQLKGVSRIRSLEKILKWGNKEVSEDTFMKLMGQKNTDYLDYIATMTSEDILPEVEKTINYLLKKDQKIAVGSASRNARTILEKVGLKSRFHCIVDGTNVSKAKPDPEVFLKAANKLNITPHNCIVFEDSIAGVEAANIANMISIGIGSAQVLKNARYVFRGFNEISTEFLTELIA